MAKTIANIRTRLHIDKTCIDTRLQLGSDRDVERLLYNIANAEGDPWYSDHVADILRDLEIGEINRKQARLSAYWLTIGRQDRT